jgi:competence protein ComEC
MLSLRAPLFSVSLAFASGCLLGLDGIATVRIALIIWIFTGLLWLFLKGREQASLVAFYLYAACAGLAYTLVLNASIPRDDLRRLPEEKSFATTQWRGMIIEEPQAQLSAHITRRSVDRTTFVLSVEAWRPTGGRLFGADIDAPWLSARGEVRCTLTGPARELKCGDRIEFAAPLEPVPPTLCPGQLDYRAWEAAQGIYYHAVISADDWQRIETGGGNWWRTLSFRARNWAYDRLQIGLEDDPRMADFLAGMLIGYRQEIPADIEQDFRRTGTLHVFAVSGQNIAEMLVVAMILLQLCGLIRWRWAWTLAPLVLIYCLLTGSPSSAVRATAMALAVLAAWKMGRPLNALGCWSLALLAMLLWDPAILIDPGAQLSFGVVLGLILIAPPLMRWIVGPFGHDPFLPRDLLSTAQIREEKTWRWLSAILGASIAATLVSEPITAIDFHQVTPISIFANLVVVPVAGLITSVGTLSVAVSILNTPLAALLNNANWLFAKLLICFVGFLAHEPGASLNVPDVRALESPAPSFIVAPVDQTACLLVRTSRGDWLINTGRESPTPSATWHLLQFYGINRLQGLVLAQISVPDNGGAEMIARDFRPRHLVVPCLPSRSALEKAVPNLVSISGGSLDLWQRGQRINLAPDVSVEVLNPALESTEGHAEDRGLVLLFHCGEGTLLWAGKIGLPAQSDLLAVYPELRADILVMGTEPPPDEAWLEALHVRYWLQIPPRDRQLNANGDTVPVTSSCEVWPLNQTGAVEVHFPSAVNGRPAGIELQPRLALPEKP